LIALIFYRIRRIKRSDTDIIRNYCDVRWLTSFCQLAGANGWNCCERFATVATLGVCIFIPFGLAEIFKQLKVRLIYSVIGGGVLLIYVRNCFFTIQARNKEWKNDETLFTADVKKDQIALLFRVSLEDLFK